VTKKPKKPRKPARELTPKSLGLADDVKLSDRYTNTRTHFKTVSDVVIGYYVGGGRQAPTRIAPIFRAEIWIRKSGDNHVITSHELGEYLNPPRAADEPPDRDGDALAHLAAEALGALEHHAAERAFKTKKR
jgi:hypothetical protein